MSSTFQRSRRSRRPRRRAREGRDHASRSTSRPRRSPTRSPAATCADAPPPAPARPIAFGIPLLARIDRAAQAPADRADPRADPRAHRADLHGARAAARRPVGLSVCSVYGGVGYEAPAPLAQPRCRRARRVPGPPRRPAPPGRARPRPGAGRGGRRSRPHGRHGLPARGPPPARPDARVTPDDVVLGDARRRDQGAHPRLPAGCRPPRRRCPRARRSRCAPRVLACRRTRSAPAWSPSSFRRPARRSCSAAPAAAPTGSRPSSRTTGVRAAAIHGGRSQNQRDRALAAFKVGRVEALVATDVAARGIHVDGVACVVHYDTPEDGKAYLHRSGRTARAGAAGSSSRSSATPTPAPWRACRRTSRSRRR